MESITYQQAIDRFCEELRKDDDLFYSYQSNIAMPIYDELIKLKRKNKKEYHEACNKGAIEFLRRLTCKVSNGDIA